MRVFPTSGFLLNPYKQKLSNSTINHYTDMKLGPVTKSDKRNTTMSKKKKKKKLTNCDVIVFFSYLWPICSYPEASFRTYDL